MIAYGYNYREMQNLKEGWSEKVADKPGEGYLQK